jgi:hypothetical protein
VISIGTPEQDRNSAAIAELRQQLQRRGPTPEQQRNRDRNSGAVCRPCDQRFFSRLASIMNGRAVCNARVAMIDSPSAKPLPFQEQLTPELLHELRRYAQGRANLVRRAGTPVSAAYARELVDDARADVWIGDLPRAPRCKLLDHLKAAIKKRTWLEIRHARRVSFVSLQEPANDEALPPEIEQALAPVPRTDCDPIKLYALAATVCQQLRSLVSRDLDAAAIVKCWADGFVEKDEVMRLTGLAEAAYRSARERLRNACRGLPSELREAAQDLLRSAA